MSLSEVDKPYRDLIDKIPKVLEHVFSKIVSLDQISLDGNEVTKAILLRMGSFYRSQNAVKNIIDKKVAGAAGAYFFSDTILFYLKTMITTHNLNVTLMSEKKIKLDDGSMQPDISVWANNELLAVIECKTQLGWNGKGWKDDFATRKKRLRSKYPDAKAFLLVLSLANWPGFESEDPVGIEYFVLSRLWPTSITVENIEENIKTPIEGLFKKIKETCIQSHSC